MILAILVGLTVAVLVASAIHRARRPVPLDPIQLNVTNGVVSMLIPGEYDIEAEGRKWFASLTPEEQQAHLEWETAEAEAWLSWARGEYR